MALDLSNDRVREEIDRDLEIFDALIDNRLDDPERHPEDHLDMDSEMRHVALKTKRGEIVIKGVTHLGGEIDEAHPKRRMRIAAITEIDLGITRIVDERLYRCRARRADGITRGAVHDLLADRLKPAE